MTQHFTTDDALYGLRNLCVGDDEQTRIADMSRDVLTPDALAALDANDYERAYALMIVPALSRFTRDELITLARGWAFDWIVADGGDDSDDDPLVAIPALADELLAMFDSLPR